MNPSYRRGELGTERYKADPQLLCCIYMVSNVLETVEE
jgi:hypothetical protein